MHVHVCERALVRSIFRFRLDAQRLLGGKQGKEAQVDNGKKDGEATVMTERPEEPAAESDTHLFTEN